MLLNRGCRCWGYVFLIECRNFVCKGIFGEYSFEKQEV